MQGSIPTTRGKWYTARGLKRYNRHRHHIKLVTKRSLSLATTTPPQRLAVRRLPLHHQSIKRLLAFGISQQDMGIANAYEYDALSLEKKRPDDGIRSNCCLCSRSPGKILESPAPQYRKKTVSLSRDVVKTRLVQHIGRQVGIRRPPVYCVAP